MSKQFLEQILVRNERYSGPGSMLCYPDVIVDESENHESSSGNPKLEDRRYRYVRCPEQFASWIVLYSDPARSGKLRTNKS